MEEVFAGVFGLLLGSGGVWVGLIQLRNLAALDSWKTTQGRVIERGTFQVEFATHSVPAFRYAPLVKYVYYVNGQEFINDSILPKHIQLPEHSSIQWAQKKAASFPDEVTVYYHPENPSASFLVRTAKVKLYLVLAGSLLAFLLGLLFLLSAL